MFLGPKNWGCKVKNKFSINKVIGSKITYYTMQTLYLLLHAPSILHS